MDHRHATEPREPLWVHVLLKGPGTVRVWRWGWQASVTVLGGPQPEEWICHPSQQCTGRPLRTDTAPPDLVFLSTAGPSVSAS